MATNHDQFNYLVGKIFAELLETFPRRITINTVQYAGGEDCEATISSSGSWTGIYLRNGEEVDLRDELDFIYDTVRWLHDTGYLLGFVGSTRSVQRHISVTLSPKALELLKAVPASVDASVTNKSFGTSLVEAVKSSAKKKVADLAGEALSYAVKAGWDTLTNS